MPRTVLTRLVVVASLALSLAACGGDDGGSAQDQPTDAASSPAEAGPVPVEAYLEGLCVAVGDYQDDVTTLSDDLQTQLDSVESTDDVKDSPRRSGRSASPTSTAERRSRRRS
jgi:hypothetical protein